MTHDETPVVDNKDLGGFLGPWPVHNDRERLRAEYMAKVDSLIAGKVHITKDHDLEREVFAWFALMDFLETRDGCIPMELVRLFKYLEKSNAGHQYGFRGQGLKPLVEIMVWAGKEQLEGAAVLGYSMLTAYKLGHLLDMETRNRMFAPLPEGDTAEAESK